MMPFGGTGVMVLGALVGLVPATLFVMLSARRLGLVTSVALAGFVWSVLVIGLVTLIPASAHTGYVPAEGRLTSCSMDYDGPAPDGFWIFGGTQRTLNTLLFVPSGVFAVLAVTRWRIGTLLAPLLGLGLVAYSFAIERIQFEVARIDRACDITDVVDNSKGVLIGLVVGVVLAAILRPWQDRKSVTTDAQRPIMGADAH